MGNGGQSKKEGEPEKMEDSPKGVRRGRREGPKIGGTKGEESKATKKPLCFYKAKQRVQTKAKKRQSIKEAEHKSKKKQRPIPYSQTVHDNFLLESYQTMLFPIERSYSYI